MVSNIEEFVSAAAGAEFTFGIIVLLILSLGFLVLFVGLVHSNDSGDTSLPGLIFVVYLVLGVGVLILSHMELYGENSLVKQRNAVSALESQIQTALEDVPKDKQLEEIYNILDEEIILGHIESYEKQSNRFEVSFSASGKEYIFMIKDADTNESSST